jgi:hypothetical protein
MQGSVYRVAAVLLGVAGFAHGAAADDFVPGPVTATTISVGGGFQFLSLPDIEFTGVGHPGAFTRQKNSDFGEYGGVGGGAIETRLGHFGNTLVTGQVRGFFANIDGDGNRHCSGGCVVADPAGGSVDGFGFLKTKTHREVDYWGGAVETKFWSTDSVEVRPNLYRNDYFILGGDVRGIDQDSRLNGRDASGGTVFTYSETLDTTYYGGYVGIGGEYSLGFLGVSGITDRFGLRSFISARAGVYGVETDYKGAFAQGPRSSALSGSADDVAFIGTLSFETRKDLGPRSSIGLYTDYEYISSVPEIRYGAGATPTRIVDDDAWGSRTILRLNIGLGPSGLYQEAPAYK